MNQNSAALYEESDLDNQKGGKKRKGKIVKDGEEEEVKSGWEQPHPRML